VDKKSFVNSFVLFTGYFNLQAKEGSVLLRIFFQSDDPACKSVEYFWTKVLIKKVHRVVDSNHAQYIKKTFRWKIEEYLVV